MKMLAFGGMALLLVALGTSGPARAQEGNAVAAPQPPAPLGPGHPFRLGACPRTRAAGQLRFQFAGHWFRVIGPLPGYGEVNWDDDDDVYIDYFKGDFHLYRLRDSGAPGATLVVLG